jgi:hypothetical protein
MTHVGPRQKRVLRWSCPVCSRFMEIGLIHQHVCLHLSDSAADQPRRTYLGQTGLGTSAHSIPRSEVGAAADVERSKLWWNSCLSQPPDLKFNWNRGPTRNKIPKEANCDETRVCLNQQTSNSTQTAALRVTKYRYSNCLDYFKLHSKNVCVYTVKLSLYLTKHALRHEGVCGSGCIDPHFLDLGTSWRWVVSFTLQPFCPRYPLYKRLCGPQSRSGRRRKKFLTPPGLELRPLGHPARSQSLYRLRYLGSLLLPSISLLIHYSLNKSIIRHTILWATDNILK